MLEHMPAAEQIAGPIRVTLRILVGDDLYSFTGRQVGPVRDETRIKPDAAVGAVLAEEAQEFCVAATDVDDGFPVKGVALDEIGR